MERILFFIEYLHSGGAERVTVALANELSKNSENEVHILTMVEDTSKEYVTEDRVIRHCMNSITMSRPNKIQSFLLKQKYLKNFIKRIQPSFIISLATPLTVFRLSLAVKGTEIPLILSERNDPRRFPKEKVFKFLRNLSYRLCDGIVFQTEGAQNYFSKSIRKKGTVICNPLTEGLPLPYEGNRAPKIVNWCRLTPQKNLDLLIDAFSDIAAEFPSHSLYIYGEGAERNHLEEKIALMNMDGRIFLPGYSTRIHEEILDAALFVSSSDYEGISNSMLEARRSPRDH